MLPVRNERNLRFADNVNAAAQRARGEYLLVLNQDTRAIPMVDDGPAVQALLRPGWVDELLRVFLAHPEVGIAGPRLVFPDGSVQSVGGRFDGMKGPFHRYLGWTNPLDARISRTEKVSWITGAAFMIRRDDYFTLGGLRGDLYPGGYFEDVHLCMEVRHQLGKEVWYCAESTLVHEVGSTGGNPHFMRNSAAFHRLWDEKIQPDTPFVYVNY